MSFSPTLSPAQLEKLDQYLQAVASAESLNYQGKKKKAAQQNLIAAKIMGKYGMEFFKNTNNGPIDALTMEWKCYKIAFEQDPSLTTACNKANLLFKRIQAMRHSYLAWQHK